MTKTEAFALMGCSGPVELAEALNITSGAISQWPDDRIPALRAYQIKEMVNKRERRSRKHSREATP